MQNPLTTHIRTDRWLYAFLSIHLIAWTLVPALIRHNLPLDSLEGAMWGHQLEWGYDKNPFLNGWLTALAVHWSDASGWMIYLFSQLSVILCFWAVWRLAKEILSPAHALIAVLMLEVVQYYNFHAIDFNDNTLELSLWTLTTYYFYRALSPRYPAKIVEWLFTGLFAALGMMAKYYTAVLLAPMATLLFVDPKHRQQLTTVPPYVGLLLFSVICFPHMVWLCHHDFITINYVFKRAGNVSHWTNHLLYPANFAWQQLLAFLPALLMGLTLGSQRTPAIASHHASASDRRFLLIIGLGPFLITLCLSLCLGITLRAGWGMPLLSLWSILWLAYWQPSLSHASLYRFITLTLFAMGSLLIGYSVYVTQVAKNSSANFPGKEIASRLTQAWTERYHTKLAYVAGDRWLGTNIGFYSTDHPSIFPEFNAARAPWIHLNDLRQHGGLLVWEINGEDTAIPAKVLKAFPTVSDHQVMVFDWVRSRPHATPIRIGVAFLAPQK